MSITLPLLPLGWTVIAERPREAVGAESLTWTEMPRRVLGVAEAHELAGKGAILMMTRHLPDRLQLVVRERGR